VYVVPLGTIVVGALLVGDVVNAVPLHIVAVWFGTTGRGLMVATTVNVGPVQLPLVGVTVYVAVCAVFVGLVSVPLILDCKLAVAPPVNPPVTTGNALHAYVVPVGTISPPPLLGVTVNPVPLQVLTVLFAIVALGLTVTVTVNVDPTQLPAAPLVGVTVYTTVCAVLVKLVKV
jgi:hypothetical protein